MAAETALLEAECGYAHDLAAWQRSTSALPLDKPAACMRALLDRDALALPLPASGNTLLRWRALADIAALDLSLAKRFEGHTDAIAILAELGDTHPPAQALWGVWCAEPPAARIGLLPDDPQLAPAHGARVRLSGTKAWCSGAREVDHALVSGWLPDGRAALAAVALRQPGVRLSGHGWQAVGMAGSASIAVEFDRVPGRLVGPPGAYVNRPGLMHGAGGVAACWYGGAARIGSHVREAAQRRTKDAHLQAHLGAIDVALSQAAALLRDAARCIDATPDDPCWLSVQRARLAVEAACDEVLHRAPRALGPTPLCSDAGLARLLADLPVFIRQGHAERDQADLGQHIASHGTVGWTL